MSEREHERNFTEAELARRELQAQINLMTPDQIEGDRWTTDELAQEFEVLGFLAPFCVVRRRKTGERGSLMFIHDPRIYFGWSPG